MTSIRIWIIFNPDKDNAHPTEATLKTIKGYKGFDKNMQCRGFQFEQGKSYETKTAKACESGFHFCEHPLDVFSYYNPADSIFCQVDGSGNIDHHDDDTKIACTKIKIGAEISQQAMIDAAIKFTFDRATWIKTNTAKKDSGAASATGDSGAASATGYRGAASATGYRGAASATGNRGAASATGDSGAASATGYSGAASATGNRGAASATGDSGAASATGYRGAASATGYRGAASATGNRGAASATGDSGAASATGYSGAASATGYSGAASATGDRGAASATGDSGAASATGYSGAASATGDSGAASATGKHSIACGLGVECKARGALGCWIVLAERKYINNEWTIKEVKSACVDGKHIKADTWYMLVNGSFKEVD